MVAVVLDIPAGAVMPRQMWRHACPNSGVNVWTGTPICSSCGAEGWYDGWHYTTYEAMAKYQSRYGLTPVGPHRRMADEIFQGTSTACEACQGRGLRDGSGQAAYEQCSSCKGLGSFFTRSAEEIAQRRRRILEAYPAAAANVVEDFPITPLALSLATGRIVDLTAAGEDDDISEGGDEELGESLGEDEDPWSAVSVADVAVALDRGLIPDLSLPGGRVLKPSGELSIRSVLCAVAPSDAESQAAVEDAFERDSVGEIFERVTGVPVHVVVSCAVSDSMVSGTWGVFEFEIGSRGYVYYTPDFGVGDDESLPILGAWEPAADPDVRRQCLLHIYVREWADRYLPPAMGQWASGDPELLQAAVLRILQERPDAWESVFERVESCPEIESAPTSLVQSVAQRSRASLKQAQNVIERVVRDGGKLAQSFAGTRVDTEEARIVVALFLHCIGKDPFPED